MLVFGDLNKEALGEHFFLPESIFLQMMKDIRGS
jgi:hypothetical protein